MWAHVSDTVVAVSLSGQMPFLLPKQQCQTTEGQVTELNLINRNITIHSKTIARQHATNPRL